MTNIYADFLKDKASNQIDSVQSYEFNGQKVWLKKAAQRHSTWIYLPLQWFSKLLGLSMLAPVPNKGGDNAVQCEVHRILALRELNINVPELLASQHNAFLLKDASSNGQPVIQLESALSQQVSTTARLELFNKAIQSIEEIHLKNNYLSEAFARNILVDSEQKISFIDFETDPAQYLSLDDCHTRDWLCFIFSTSHRFQESELDQATTLLLKNLKSHPALLSDICKVGRKITWILALKPEKLGGDGRRLKKCIHFLKLLNEKQ